MKRRTAWLSGPVTLDGLALPWLTAAQQQIVIEVGHGGQIGTDVLPDDQLGRTRWWWKGCSPARWT